MRRAQVYDGVIGVTQCAIQPRSQYVYNFTVDELPGSYWWHSQSRYALGQWHDLVSGPLVVHEGSVPAEAHTSPYSYANERILFFTDMFKDVPDRNTYSLVGNLYEATSRGLAGDIVGVLPWWGALLNGGESGSNQTVINVNPGEAYTFRLICGTSLYALNFSIPGAALRIIATDGSPLPKPFDADIIFCYPGERYDIELQFDMSMAGQTLSIEASTLESPKQGYNNGARGLLRIGSSAPYKVSRFISLPKKPVVANCYEGQASKASCYSFREMVEHSGLPSSSPSSSQGSDALGTVSHKIDFSFAPPPQYSHFVRIDGGLWYQHVNPHYPMIGSAYPVALHEHTAVLDVPFNSTVILILKTRARLYRPIHIHGHKFEVLEQYTADQDTDCYITACFPNSDYDSDKKIEEYKQMPFTGVLKDTVVLPVGGVTVVRFKADNPGAWLAHCQFPFEMDDGMALIVRVGTPSALQSIALPSDFPVCAPEDTVQTEPACQCYFDVDALRFSQLDGMHRCSRKYLCLHDKEFYPATNFEPTLNQGISMHKLSPYTGVVLGLVFPAMIAVAFIYNYYSKKFSESMVYTVGNTSDGEQPAPRFFSTFEREFMLEWHQCYKEAINYMRVVEVSGLAILTGIVFWKVGEDTSNRGLRESVSLLFFSTTLWTFTRMYPAIPAHFLWVNRVEARLKTTAAGEGMPSALDVFKLGLCRSAVVVCAESWWPIIFGLIVYPIAHINGKVGVWFQHISFLILNNLCYISFGAVVGTVAPIIPVGMIASTLYSQTSLVCAGFYKTLPSWLAWFRYISYVFYTFSGLVRGAYMWQDSYTCRAGDSRVGQNWCLLETAGTIEDMKIRGISVANSSDPETNNVGLCQGMLIVFFVLNTLLLGMSLYRRVVKKYVELHPVAKAPLSDGETELFAMNPIVQGAAGHKA
jgi:FtsP/CotA-like multicopper oxidase with cupredoxin domain